VLTLKRRIILGVAVFLTVWATLSSLGQVGGSANEANETLPPTLVSPANNAWVTENKPTFTWIFNDPDPNDSQSGFNLQISTEINFVNPLQNITDKSNTESYTLTTALNDGMYYWRVKTNDTNGVWSIWSNVWIVGIDTTPPDPVSASFRLHVKLDELIVGESVELNWTASEDPYFEQYEIYASTDPTVLNQTKLATIINVRVTMHEIKVGPKGLDPGTTYSLCVVVVDQAGLKSEYATVTVTTTAPLNWSLIGGLTVAVELAIAVIIFALSRLIKKE